MSEVGTESKGGATGASEAPKVKQKVKSSAEVRKAKKAKRAKKKANKRQQFVWFCGHASILATSSLVILAYATLQSQRLVSQILYRMVFVSAVFTYGMSLRKSMGMSHKGRKSASVFHVMHLPTFQYGALAALWLFSKSHLLKLTPYFVYSLLQTSHFASKKLVKDEGRKQQLDDFLQKHARFLERVVANSNILLFLRLLLDIVLLRRGAAVSMIVYTLYFRLTIDNPQTARALDHLEEQADKAFAHPKMPAKVQELWKKLKWTIDHRDTYALTPEQLKEKERKMQEDKERNKKEQKQVDEKMKDTESDGEISGGEAENLDDEGDGDDDGDGDGDEGDDNGENGEDDDEDKPSRFERFKRHLPFHHHHGNHEHDHSSSKDSKEDNKDSKEGNKD